MGKRKRISGEETNGSEVIPKTASKSDHREHTADEKEMTIQIITGTYERALHGMTATITDALLIGTESAEDIDFADTFLFNAHGSAIRCLALSPISTSSDKAQAQKLILASGGTDERINLYHISTSLPPKHDRNQLVIPSINGSKITENPKNRELGSLLHHVSSISALYFPTSSKLLSAAEDNTITVSRTRDWTVLSTIKVPIPKAHGRPSGDTAPLGGTPAGVNDFAVHPTMKLMVSVGKGEGCMRLWNLVTGKKAGVLSFEKSLLQSIGEGRWASGEGRRVEWDSVGKEFAVAFERAVVVFGMDSKPRSRIIPWPPSKVHQIRYLPLGEGTGGNHDVLALSTEDGRVLFYDTTADTATMKPSSVEPNSAVQATFPSCKTIGQLGGAAAGVAGRIKDFEILNLPSRENHGNLIVVTASSDGAIRLWTIDGKELSLPQRHANRIPDDIDRKHHNSRSNGTGTNGRGPNKGEPQQVGRLLGVYETGNRITCLKAFIMTGQSEPRSPAAGRSRDGMQSNGDTESGP